jgi:chromate reductase, NAD(P)H dehydrogenase (quinone)
MAMTDKFRVLSLCGSLRSGSTNEAALRTIARLASDDMTVALFTGIAALPHFNPDDDNDPLHPAVAELRAQIVWSDALLISTPEYAGDLPGAFKNMLDWTVGGVEICDKPTAWINVSNAGPHGAANTHESLRRVLSFTGAKIIEEACVRIPVPRDSVGAEGAVENSRIREQLADALHAFVAHAKTLNASQAATEGN